MLIIKTDSQSPYQLHLPVATDYREILALGRAFMQQENNLPSEERTPKTGEINSLVQALAAARQRAYAAEGERRRASENLKQAEQEARQLIRIAQRMLEITFVNEPQQAHDWGFIARQTGPSAGRILLPASRHEVMDCLDSYINKEESRPVAERFPTPSYEQMVAARANLTKNLLMRNKNKQLRKQARAEALTLTRQLRKALKAALAHLVVYHFNDEIRPELENWGFKVTQRQPTAVRETQPAYETAAEPA